MTRAFLASWFAVVVTAPLALAPPAVSGVPPRAPQATARVVVTTANIFLGLPPARARADIRRAAERSTIVAGQEMGGRRASAFAPRGWRAFQPARPACRELATWWKAETWALVRTRVRVLVISDIIPSATRCATVVVLRHRATGLRLPVVNIHMVPHVEVNGHPRANRLVPLFARDLVLIRRIAAAARDRWGLALLAGDWNVDYPDDRRVQWWGFPYARLHERWDTHWGKLPMTGPTHERRRIDAVWWSESRRIRPVDSTTIRRTWSDHNFVRVALSIRVR